MYVCTCKILYMFGDVIIFYWFFHMFLFRASLWLGESQRSSLWNLLYRVSQSNSVTHYRTNYSLITCIVVDTCRTCSAHNFYYVRHMFGALHVFQYIMYNMWTCGSRYWYMVGVPVMLVIFMYMLLVVLQLHMRMYVWLHITDLSTMYQEFVSLIWSQI